MEARKLGYSTTKLGARRHLPDLNSSNKWEAAKAERQAVNFKIQGSGAEMTKLAMGRIWEANIRNQYDVRFFAPIHDEMVFSISLLSSLTCSFGFDKSNSKTLAIKRFITK